MAPANIEQAKKAAAEKAVTLIEPGMTVGLGTGSTAHHVIRRIGEKVRDGMEIRAVATSRESAALAEELRIPMAVMDDIESIDIAIDGADEIDPAFRLIKGGGGALLREKIIAAAATQFVVVADERKMVPFLGQFPLPVEVTPFGWELTFRKLGTFQCNPVLRQRDGEIFVTDNGNYIIDCAFDRIRDPQELHIRLNNIPGVVENGLFLGYAHVVMVGAADGSVKVYHPPVSL